jgi:hypothetical protein
VGVEHVLAKVRPLAISFSNNTHQELASLRLSLLMRKFTFPAAMFVLTLAIAAIVPGRRVQADLTVFNDTFTTGGSVLNPSSYPTPTASTTGYDIASTKNTTGMAIGSGKLTFGMAATTSGFVEAQARFATTPVALTNANDFIRMTVVFKDSNNLLGGGASSSLAFGLYNAGGANPINGLALAGLNTTAGSSFATGNAQLWQGYVAQIRANTGNNTLLTRPVQNGAGTTSANQDLLGNAAGGGLYNNPAGATIGGNTASTATLTNGNSYTYTLLLTFNGTGIKIDQNLYNGVGTGGTNLATQTNTATGANLLTQSFDGLAVGYRQSGTSVITAIELNSILIERNDVMVDVPEASALAMTGAWLLTAVGIAVFSHRRRRSS